MVERQIEAAHGAHQLIVEFGIERAEPMGNFHAQRLNAGRGVEAHHLVEAKIQEIGAQTLLRQWQAHEKVEGEPS